MKLRLLAFPLVLAATAAAYLPCLRGEFQFDDAMGIERGGWLLPEGAKVSGLLSSLSSWSSRGLVTASYQLDYWMAGGASRPSPSLNSGLEGVRPLSFHLFNLAVHLLTAGALYAVLAKACRGGGPSWGPLAGAAFFALHPLATESVAYVSARTGTLAACFGLWGAAALLGLGAPDRGGVRRPFWHRALAAGVFALGARLSIGCKETGWIFPPLGAALLWGAYGGDAKAIWRDWSGAIVAGGAAFLLAACLWGRGLGLIRPPPLTVLSGLSPADAWIGHAITQLHAWCTGLLPRALLPIGPWHPSVDLNLPVLLPSSGQALAWASLEAAGVLGALLWSRRRPWALAAMLWILLGALPPSAIPLQDVTAERHAYLPLTGVALMVAFALPRLRVRPAFLTVLSVLALLTSVRASQWGTEDRLWRSAVRDAPAKPRPHYNRAKALMREAIGDPVRAEVLAGSSEQEVRRALRIWPGFHLAHGLLAWTCERQERWEEACGQYRRALECHGGVLLLGESPGIHAEQMLRASAGLMRCLERAGRGGQASEAVFHAVSIHAEAIARGGDPGVHERRAAQLLDLLAGFHRGAGREEEACRALREGERLISAGRTRLPRVDSLRP